MKLYQILDKRYGFSFQLCKRFEIYFNKAKFDNDFVNSVGFEGARCRQD